MDVIGIVAMAVSLVIVAIDYVNLSRQQKQKHEENEKKAV